MGLGVTVLLNVLFVPHFGYMACAWAALGCYGFMMVASWAVGNRKYPIGYDLKLLGLYFLAAMLLWGASMLMTVGNNWIDFPLRALLLALFGGCVLFLNRIPALRTR